MLEHSLLSDPLFRGTVGPAPPVPRLSLPQVLSRLSAGEDLGFTTLRPHQQAPLHAFVVQLAYLALESDDDPRPPTDAEAWATLLRALTPDHSDDGPWCLLNNDWQAPAFLQPPCSPGREADFKGSADSAQDIDLLVTSRHHDEKTRKLALQVQDLDTLVYALIDLQGWAPVLGRGNYNSMRMNTGFGSRSQFRLAYERGSGAEFRRDLAALLDDRAELEVRFLAAHGAEASAEYRLLWLVKWDEGSLPLASVHPYCLEVCRRLRLVREGCHLLMRRAGSDAMRVAAKDQRGVVLDPWVPVVRGDEPKALTAQANSLSYQHLQELIFDREKVDLPLLARPTSREREANLPGMLIARVLVGGQGSTDGWLSRELPMPAPVLAQMESKPAVLAQRSKLFERLAGLAAGTVLRGALLQFVDGSSKVDRHNRDFSRAVKPWVTRFESAVDEAFFVQLFHTIEGGKTDIEAQRQWVHWLADNCEVHLQDATDALPTRHGSRHVARARAQRLLHLSLRKQFGAFLASPAADLASADAANQPAPPDQPEEVVHA